MGRNDALEIAMGEKEPASQHRVRRPARCTLKPRNEGAVDLLASEVAHELGVVDRAVFAGVDLPRRHRLTGGVGRIARLRPRCRSRSRGGLSWGDGGGGHQRGLGGEQGVQRGLDSSLEMGGRGG